MHTWVHSNVTKTSDYSVDSKIEDQVEESKNKMRYQRVFFYYWIIKKGLYLSQTRDNIGLTVWKTSLFLVLYHWNCFIGLVLSENLWLESRIICIFYLPLNFNSLSIKRLLQFFRPPEVINSMKDADFEKIMNYSSTAWPTDWFSHLTKFYDAFFHLNPMNVAGDNASFVMDNVAFQKMIVLKQNYTSYDK